MACPLCSQADAEFVLKKNGYTLVRCQGCGLIYVSPMPTAAELAAHYQDAGYFEGDAQQGYRDYAAMEKALRPLFERRLRALAQQFPQRGRLLDYGCAAGYFLAMAAADGWQVQGVELATEMAQQAAARSGALVVTTLDELPDAPFDVITLWEVIEHLPQPAATMQALAARLRPGGMVMLSTPNTAHWQAVREPQRWGGYRPPSHLTFLTPDTLARIMQAAGLQRVQVAGTAPLPPLPPWLDTATASLQRGLADGSARPWPVALALWRGVRLFAWGWQKVAQPQDDIFATLEASGRQPGGAQNA